MIDYPAVLAECNADTLLAQIVLSGEPVHAPNKGDLSNRMIKRPNMRLIGIVDNDKAKFPYLDSFEPVEKSDGLILCKHKDRKHFTIVVDPAWERWIWRCCEESGVDPAAYGFRSWKALMNQSKSQIRNMDPKVKELLNTLNQKKNPGFVTMAQWLNDFENKKGKFV